MEYTQQRPSRSDVDRAGIHSLCLLFPSAGGPLLNVVSQESGLFVQYEGLEIGQRIIFQDTVGLRDLLQSFRFFLRPVLATVMLSAARFCLKKSARLFFNASQNPSSLAMIASAMPPSSLTSAFLCVPANGV